MGKHLTLKTTFGFSPNTNSVIKRSDATRRKKCSFPNFPAVSTSNLWVVCCFLLTNSLRPSNRRILISFWAFCVPIIMEWRLSTTFSSKAKWRQMSSFFPSYIFLQCEDSWPLVLNNFHWKHWQTCQHGHAAKLYKQKHLLLSRKIWAVSLVKRTPAWSKLKSALCLTLIHGWFEVWEMFFS